MQVSKILITSEVDRHRRVLNFKPKDIAVIVDTCLKEHICIKNTLLNCPEPNLEVWI